MKTQPSSRHRTARFIRAALLLPILFNNVSLVRAVDYTWNYPNAATNTASQSWFTPGNWTPSGHPGAVTGQVDNILGFSVGNTANLRFTSAYNINTFNVTPLGGQTTLTAPAVPTWVVESVTSDNTLNINTLNVNPTQFPGTTFTFRNAANSTITLAVNVGQINIYGATTPTVFNLGITNIATTSGDLKSIDVSGGTTFLGSGNSVTGLNIRTAGPENLGLISTGASFSGNAALNLNNNTSVGSVNLTNTVNTTGLSSNASATGAVTIAGSIYPYNASNPSPGIVTTTLAINNNADYSANFTLIDNANAAGTQGFLKVTKAGTGTQTLTSANSYSGGTTITGGKLLLNNTTGSGTGTGLVSVASGGTLGGTGTIAPTGVTSGVAVDVLGALSPGNGNEGTLGGIGALTLALNSGTASSVRLGSGSKFTFDLGAVGASDSILLTGGSLDLNGQQISDFTFNQLAGFGAGTYTLFDTAAAGDITGALGSLVTQSFGAYTGTLALGTDVNGFASLNLVVVSGVPEPSTYAMLAGGLVLLITSAYRRNARRSAPLRVHR